MTVLLDTSFPGADVDPLPTAGAPFSKASTPTLRRISNTVGVSVANNFADIYDDSNTYPDAQWSEITIGTLGNRDFGPVVRDNGSRFYFVQNAGGGNINLYEAFTFNLLYSVAGTWAVGNRVALETVGAPTLTTLNIYVEGALVGTHMQAVAFAGGKPGLSMYDGAGRISRLRTGDGAYPGIGGGGGSGAGRPMQKTQAGRIAPLLRF